MLHEWGLAGGEQCGLQALGEPRSLPGLLQCGVGRRGLLGPQSGVACEGGRVEGGMPTCVPAHFKVLRIHVGAGRGERGTSPRSRGLTSHFLGPQRRWCCSVKGEG